MTWKKIALAAALAGAAALGLGVAWDSVRVRPAPLNAAEPDQPKTSEDKDRAADRDAVRESTKELVKLFEKADGKAVADLWTEEGEYVSDDGTTFRGRAALEAAYGQFFKKNPDLKLELDIESIRFLSRDSAIEEGVARTHKGGKAGEPTSSRYSTLYAREDGRWLIALLREWPDEGVALRDLDWLIGTLGGQDRRPRRASHLRVGREQALHPRPVHGQGQGSHPLRHTVDRQGPAHRPAAFLAVRRRRRLRRRRLDLGRQALAPGGGRRRAGRRRDDGHEHPDAAGQGLVHLAVHRPHGGRRGARPTSRPSRSSA